MVRFRGWIRGRRDHRESSSTTASPVPNNSFNVRFFCYETLRLATNDFSTLNLIGRGAYGSVFKGVLPDDGRTVAIKTYHNPDQARFLQRVDLLSHLHHVNLVQVIGCCLHQHQLLLVCKFTENGNVSQLLHTDNRSASASAFDWKRRAAVCIGIARGLLYLHEEIDPPVIHCDIKPANVLLDANFVPKIVDFDLMQFPDVEEEEDSSNYSYSTVKGTPGYMDPNYMSTGQLTDKVDVYSFGVTMLEIITGRRVVDPSLKDPDDRMILDWVTRVRKEGPVLQIVDPKLTDFPKEDVERFINVALLCTQAAPEQRPTMFQVVHMLYGRHNSDQEISAMADVTVAAQLVRWFSRNSTLSSVSMSSSLTISTSAKADITDGSTSTRMKDDAQSTEGSSKAARSGDSSSKEEEESCKEDLVRAYFERSMEKIVRFQTAVHSASNRGTTMITTKTMVTKRSSQRVSMEAVYPPFLSGEYSRRSIQF